MGRDKGLGVVESIVFSNDELDIRMIPYAQSNPWPWYRDLEKETSCLKAQKARHK